MSSYEYSLNHPTVYLGKAGKIISWDNNTQFVQLRSSCALEINKVPVFPTDITNKAYVDSLHLSINNIDTNQATQLNSLSTGLNNELLLTNQNTANTTLLSTSTSTNHINLYSSLSSQFVNVNSLSTGISTTNSHDSSLSTGISTINSYASSLSTGISTENVNASSLSTGLSTTNSNVVVLSTGLSTTNSNATSLSTGLSTTNSDVVVLSTKLSTTNSDATSLSNGLSTTNSNVVVLSTTLSNTNSYATSLSTGLSTTNSNVVVLSSGLSTTNSNANSLSTGLSTTNSNANSLSTGLSSTISNASSLSTGLSSTNSNITSLSTGLSTNNNTITLLSNSTSSTVSANTSILGTINNTNTSIINLSVTYQNITVTVTQVSTKLSTTMLDVTSLSTGLSTTTINVTSLSTGLSSETSGVGSLSTGLSSVTSGITSLSTGISTTTSNVASLSTSLITTNSNITSLSTAVSSDITLLNNKIVVEKNVELNSTTLNGGAAPLPNNNSLTSGWTFLTTENGSIQWTIIPRGYGTSLTVPIYTLNQIYFQLELSRPTYAFQLPAVQLVIYGQSNIIPGQGEARYIDVYVIFKYSDLQTLFQKGTYTFAIDALSMFNYTYISNMSSPNILNNKYNNATEQVYQYALYSRTENHSMGYSEILKTISFVTPTNTYTPSANLVYTLGSSTNTLYYTPNSLGYPLDTGSVLTNYNTTSVPTAINALVTTNDSVSFMTSAAKNIKTLFINDSVYFIFTGVYNYKSSINFDYVNGNSLSSIYPNITIPGLTYGVFIQKIEYTTENGLIGLSTNSYRPYGPTTLNGYNFDVNTMDQALMSFSGLITDCAYNNNDTPLMIYVGTQFGPSNTTDPHRRRNVVPFSYTTSPITDSINVGSLNGIVLTASIIKTNVYTNGENNATQSKSYIDFFNIYTVINCITYSSVTNSFLIGIGLDQVDNGGTLTTTPSLQTKLMSLTYISTTSTFSINTYTIPLNSYINTICSNANCSFYVAVGYNTAKTTQIMYLNNSSLSSTYEANGSNWIASTSVLFLEANTICCSENLWLIGGEANTTVGATNKHSLAYSIDGITWTGLSYNTTSNPFTRVSKIMWTGLSFIASGYNSTQQSIVCYSASGKNWTIITTLNGLINPNALGCVFPYLYNFSLNNASVEYTANSENNISAGTVQYNFRNKDISKAYYKNAINKICTLRYNKDIEQLIDPTVTTNILRRQN